MTGHKPTRPALIQTALLLASTLVLAPQIYAHGNQADEGVSRLFIGSKKVKEVCLELKAAESIRYGFEASAPLAFNIHYHEGEVLHYPVKRSAIQMLDAVLSAQISQTYCLMWTNSDEDPVDLELRLQRPAAGYY